MSIEGEDLEQFDDNVDMSSFVVDTEEGSIVEEEDVSENEIDSSEQSSEESAEKVAKGDETDDDDTSEDSSGEGEDDTSPGDKLYSSLADNMRERGILSSLDPEKLKDIKDIDSLMDAFNSELSTREFGDLNDKQKAYLQGLREGIPEEVVSQHIKVTEQLSSITEDELNDNEELRKEVIKAQYQSINNMSEEKAEKLAQLAIDTGEDANDAIEALQLLKEKNTQEYEAEINAKKKAKLDAEKKTQQTIEGFKNKIDSSKEIFKGMEINKTEKEKLFNQMTRPAGTTQEGRSIDVITKTRMENPEDFTLKLHYLFMKTNGFKDIDSFIKSSKSKAAQDLDHVLRNQSKNPGSGGSNTPPVSSEFEKMGDIV